MTVDLSYVVLSLSNGERGNDCEALNNAPSGGEGAESKLESE